MQAVLTVFCWYCVLESESFLLLNFRREMAKRSCNEAFKLVFTELDGEPKCVVSLKVLSTESIKQNKLQRHFETNHLNCVDKPVEFFKRKLKSVQGQRNVMTAFTTKTN